MRILNRKWFVLLPLFLIFSLPGIVAYLCYLHPQWLAEARTNQGALLNPPMQVLALGNGAKWRLVLWSPNLSEEACLKQLDKLARIRLALGRKLYQVELQLLTKKSRLSPWAKKWLQERDIHVVKLAAVENNTVLNEREQVFIANSQDYLVLSYPQSFKPEAIYHDLKKLVSS